MSRSVLANLHVETLHLRLCPYAIPPDIPVCAIPCQSLTNVSILSTSIIANILGDPSFHVDDHSNIWPLFSLFSSYPVIFSPLCSLSYIYLHQKLNLVPPNGVPTTTFASNYGAFCTDLLSSFVNYFIWPFFDLMWTFTFTFPYFHSLSPYFFPYIQPTFHGTLFQ